MYSTAEGRSKGPDWAKRAIWGNVPDDVKAKYGSVDNLTSREFSQLWADKVGRFSGSPQMALASDVAAKTSPQATTPPNQGEKPVLDILAALLGGGGQAAAGTAATAGGSTMGPMPMGGGGQAPGGGQGMSLGPLTLSGNSDLAKGAMQSAAGGPEQSMLAGPSQAARPPDLQQLMAVLSQRQKLGLGG
jgi:hypothetical protein